MHCTKISPEFECQGQRSRSPETKNALSATDNPRVCTDGMRLLQTDADAAAADGPILWLPGGVFRCHLPVLRQWENQRMLSTFD